MDLTTNNAGCTPSRISFWFMVLLLVLVVWLHLAAPALASLFTYLALSCLLFVKGRGGRWLAVIIFLIFLSGIAYAMAHFVNVTVREMPEIANNSIPSVITWAKQQGMELPFTDYDSLKDAGARFGERPGAELEQLRQGRTRHYDKYVCSSSRAAWWRSVSF